VGFFIPGASQTKLPCARFLYECFPSTLMSHLSSFRPQGCWKTLMEFLIGVIQVHPAGISATVMWVFTATPSVLFTPGSKSSP